MTSRGSTINRSGLIVSFIALGMVACEKQVSPPRPEVPVTVAEARKADVPVEIRAIGNVEPLQSVAIRAQVGGELVEVSFEEGQDVIAGEVMFRIDSRPYEAALAQAQATLARDQALEENAAQDARRYEELVRKDYVTKEQYGRVKSGSEAYKATLQADEAAIVRAKLDLEYCTIQAPISGRSGSLMFKRGAIVKANDSTLVVVHQIHPILVKFAVPAQNLAEIQRYGGRTAMGVTAYPVRDGDKPVTGHVIFVDNAVDTSTDTIALKARFENERNLLWPGQFLDVVLELDVLRQVTVIPGEAVQTGQQGTTVFVVKSDRTVEIRPVKVGRSANGLVVIEEGVRADESVVTDGQLRLVPGSKVEIKPALEQGGGAGR
ncbi:MAG: efflux RND transporter periplasmic adaptor subunit [Acidobacteria bacterium]|nr:efflux RND transporter periplasmic adaptor subunit [Acidobacteriota bacterium]